MGKLKLLLILAFAGALSACNVSGNITDVTLHSSSVQIGELTGIESGAQVQTIVATQYTVQSSLGDPIAAVMTTTSGGYTVYSNVQGDMASQASVTTNQ